MTKGQDFAVVFAKATRNGGDPETQEEVFTEKTRAGVRRQAALVALELLLP